MLVPFSMHGNFLSKLLVTDKSSICMEHPQVVDSCGWQMGFGKQCFLTVCSRWRYVKYFVLDILLTFSFLKNWTIQTKCVVCSSIKLHSHCVLGLHCSVSYFPLPMPCQWLWSANKTSYNNTVDPHCSKPLKCVYLILSDVLVRYLITPEMQTPAIS